ncbi:restriction endonuclease subunit S [Burkholderia gladioli]|uniref:restriction endonuclease subunit S n=1 Tax=Burkholderia gladioli TaxID=28095 RepID=UPI00163EEB46|nr:restriction endonuclease subunit S [Burkholderia gladioli]
MNSYDCLKFAPKYIMEVEGQHEGMFRAHKGKRLTADDRRPGRTPFVGGSRMNNSITDFADTPPLFPGGWLTLIYNGDGGTGHARYQPAPFSASDDVIALEPLSESAREPALLLVASMITQQCVPKFGFGYKLKVERLKRQKIMVPVKSRSDGAEVIDWDGLNQLGQELLVAARLQAKNVRRHAQSAACALPTLTFEPMFISEIFESMKASSAWRDKVSLKSGDGSNIYLSQTRSSNSVSEIVADQGMVPEPGNCITMTLKTQAIFYQSSPFYTAQNFLILRHPRLNADNGMILVTALRRAAEKFSWGYGISMGRMNKTHIMVPTTSNCNGKRVVDWEGMSLYGRALHAEVERFMDAVLKPVAG